MAENTAEVVGAEAIGEAGKIPVLDTIGEGFVQVFAVAEENTDQAEDRGDAGGYGGAGPVLLVGRRGFGACGMRRRFVHGGLINN